MEWRSLAFCEVVDEFKRGVQQILLIVCCFLVPGNFSRLSDFLTNSSIKEEKDT